MARFLEAFLGAGRAEGRRLTARIALAALAILALLFTALNITSIAAAFGEMGQYLQYRFIQRALAVGVLVALCAALLGVTLVLKRYSMIGDGLSHVGFGALSVAAALGFVTADSLPGFLPGGLRSAISNFLKKPGFLSTLCSYSSQRDNSFPEGNFERVEESIAIFPFVL